MHGARDQDEEPGGQTTSRTRGCMRFEVVHGPRVAVRASPSTDCRIVGARAQGSVVEAAALEDGWVKLVAEGWMLVDGTALGFGALLRELPEPLEPPALLRAFPLALEVRLRDAPPANRVLSVRVELMGEAAGATSRVAGPFVTEAERERVLVRGLQPSQRVRLRAEASTGAKSDWLQAETTPALADSSACCDVMGVERGGCSQCACASFHWTPPADGRSVLNMSPDEWTCLRCGCDAAAHAPAAPKPPAQEAVSLCATGAPPTRNTSTASLAGEDELAAPAASAATTEAEQAAEREALVARLNARQAPRLWQRLPAVRRVWAVSDLHVEHRENLDWLRAWPRRPQDALVVAGDVCTRIELLQQTLELLRSKFRLVFYCVGNHELWAPRNEPHADSLEKLVALLEAAEAAGAVTSAALVGDELAVVPLHSWYHPGFREGRSPADADFMLHATPNKMAQNMDVGCRWPACLHAHRDLAQFFARCNEPALQAATDSGLLRGRQVVSCSHFLPHPRLHRGAHWLGDAEGSAPLGEQVRMLCSDVHIFGHTHWDVDATVEGTRYVQRPLGYPRERRDESYRVGAKPSADPEADVGSAFALAWTAQAAYDYAVP